MDGRRLRLDLFAFSLGALSLLTLGFFVARNGAAVIMCSLCFAGLVAARERDEGTVAEPRQAGSSRSCSSSGSVIRSRSRHTS